MDVIASGLAILVTGLAATAFAEVPTTVGYNGVLLQSYPAAQAMTFRLCDSPTTGNCPWEEKHDGLGGRPESVHIQDGYYHVELGTQSPISPSVMQATHWLEVQVGTNEPLAERVDLRSPVPLALECGEATTLGGRQQNEFIWAQTAVPQAGGFNVQGNALIGGKLGIGTTNPAGKLVVHGTVHEDYGYENALIAAEGVGDTIGLGIYNPSVHWDVVNIVTTEKAFLGFTPDRGGAINFRMGVDGSFTIPGSCSSNDGATCASDLAETFLSVDGATPGDVVSLDRSAFKALRLTSSPYDPLLVGVVSTNPTVIMGERDASGGISVALAGVVPVKVSLQAGAISVGDFLTSSSTPGRAMRANRPGPVVGKAMEAFDGSFGREGTVHVLVAPAVSSCPCLETAGAKDAELARLSSLVEIQRARLDELGRDVEALKAVILGTPRHRTGRK